jgi:hypothetical protein
MDESMNLWMDGWMDGLFECSIVGMLNHWNAQTLEYLVGWMD